MVEDLIYQVITSNSVISNLLAKYDGKPAVFYQRTPKEDDPKWEGGTTLPNLEYDIYWKYDLKRESAGTMQVKIRCFKDSDVLPQNICMAITPDLTQLFLTDENRTYCLLWDKTDILEDAATISFHVMEFLDPISLEPDPVAGLNRFIKNENEEAVVIGVDTLEPIWKPSNDHLAIFVKLVVSKSKRERSSYACTWMSATLNIRVIAPSAQKCQEWMQKITHEIGLRGEFVMTNGSPFLITNVKENLTFDPTHYGQISVTGLYGVLNREEKSELLWHANLNRV